MIFENIANCFRGGKMIDIDNDESKQIDIILAAKNLLKIFSTKGLFPIETVMAGLSVMATLDFQKLKSIIEEFKSIPRYHHSIADVKEHELVFKERLPYKFAIGYHTQGQTNRQKSEAFYHKPRQQKK